MTAEAALLFIHAQTSLHPGTGAALGAVDLPVQRERHTQWPTIAGSSLKGVLRDACRPVREDWLAVFGPETAEADKHAGALSLTDARVLAFPVRSLKGVFAWVTCRAVLERLCRDLELAKAVKRMELCNRPVQGEALCRRDELALDGKLVLEEFEFACTGAADSVANWIADQAVADDFTRSRLRSHLAVLHDDDFTHFVRHATEVVARVGLNYDTKTVKSGALFYEEFVPPETLFYSVVLASASRREGRTMPAAEVLSFVQRRTPPILQIGGDETIGKGLCAVRFVPGKDGE